jgi:retinoblastoma-like protein 1
LRHSNFSWELHLSIQWFADGITHFEGLMEDEALTSHLLIMEKDYDEWYHSRGELDERMFINGEDSLIGAVSSGGTPSVSGVKVSISIIILT